jgi:hypothetical protein
MADAEAEAEAEAAARRSLKRLNPKLKLPQGAR